MSNHDDDYVMVVRHIVVKGPRAAVEEQLALCWLQPGPARTGARVSQQEIHRSPPELIDAEDHDNG